MNKTPPPDMVKMCPHTKLNENQSIYLFCRQQLETDWTTFFSSVHFTNWYFHEQNKHYISHNFSIRDTLLINDTLLM